MRCFLITLLIVLVSSAALCGESLTLEFTQTEIPRPEGRAIAGDVPRPLVLVQLHEEEGRPAGRDETIYYTLDPAEPDATLRRVFSGPGDKQYCRLVTPLFGGCGVATGGIDPEKETGFGRSLFWFDLLSGTPGNTIVKGGWRTWICGTELRLFFENRLHRYDLKTGILTRYESELYDPLRLDENTVLAIAEMNGEGHVVLISVDEGKADVLAPPPPGVSLNDSYHLRFSGGLHPAGPNCRDGVYYVSGFSLWYKPRQGEWRAIAEDVHIVKTFGGRESWLPVQYLGNDRFAVARTTKDEVEVPDDPEPYIPKALSVTMLVDGKTGKVLEEAEPVTYDHNPPLNIPDNWWAEGCKPEEEKHDEEARGDRLFGWDSETRTITYGDAGEFHLAKDDTARISPDGRYIVLYSKARDMEPPSEITFTLLDGKTGTEKAFSLSSETNTLYVNVLGWQVLCSQEVREQDMDGFKSTGFDWFREPLW